MKKVILLAGLLLAFAVVSAQEKKQEKVEGEVRKREQQTTKRQEKQQEKDKEKPQEASPDTGDARKPVEAPRASGARFAFKSTEHDFGDIPHRSPKVEHRFAFTNDGTAPLVITKVLTSCSCVKVNYGKKPIPPGGKGEIVVTYEVNKKESGVFYKVIEIYSNSPDKRNNLIVKGNAIE